MRQLLAATALIALAAPAAASVVDYNSRAAFQAASNSLTLEDFEDAAISPGGGVGVTGPVDTLTNDGVFQPGDIVPGLIVNALGQSGGNLAVVGDNYGNTGIASVTVFANNATGIRLTFSVPVFALGLDALAFAQGNTRNVELFDLTGSIGTYSLFAPSTGSGAFIGFTSTTSILSATITGAGFQGVDNIEFGQAGVGAVPEPASLALLGLGLGALAYRRRKV